VLVALVPNERAEALIRSLLDSQEENAKAITRDEVRS
jgi:hypothetical protein